MFRVYALSAAILWRWTRSLHMLALFFFLPWTVGLPVACLGKIIISPQSGTLFGLGAAVEISGTLAGRKAVSVTADITWICSLNSGLFSTVENATADYYVCECGTNPPEVSVQRTEVDVVDSGKWGEVKVMTVDVQIASCADNGVWRPCVVSVVGNYDVEFLICPEITAPDEFTTEELLCHQVQNLANARGGNTEFGFIRAAVVAHEAVHEKHVLPSLQNATNTFRAAIGGLSVEDIGQSSEHAIEELMALPEYSKAVEELRNDWYIQMHLSSNGDHGANFDGPAYAAELPFTQPMLEVLLEYARNQDWFCAESP